MSEYIIIDPVVPVPTRIVPVNGFFDAIGSALSSGFSTVASKLGTIANSSVFSKLLEGGLAIGGGLLTANIAAKAQKQQLLAGQNELAQMQAAQSAQAVQTAQAAQAVQASQANNKQLMIYGGLTAAGLLTVYMLLKSKNKTK